MARASLFLRGWVPLACFSVLCCLAIFALLVHKDDTRDVSEFSVMSNWNVVDANFSRSPLLENYLRADVGNYVVFTDHGCMESYKGPGLKNLSRSLDIVSRYPSQVVVLKSTRKIVALQSKSSFTTSRDEFVDRDQTREFRQFCAAVRCAAIGIAAPWLAEQLLAKGEVANNHFARLLKDAELGSQAVRTLGASYDASLLKQLRTRAPISDDGVQTIINGILWLAAILFRDHPTWTNYQPAKNYLVPLSSAMHWRDTCWRCAGSRMAGSKVHPRGSLPTIC